MVLVLTKGRNRGQHMSTPVYHGDGGVTTHLKHTCKANKVHIKKPKKRPPTGSQAD